MTEIKLKNELSDADLRRIRKSQFWRDIADWEPHAKQLMSERLARFGRKAPNHEDYEAVGGTFYFFQRMRHCQPGEELPRPVYKLGEPEPGPGELIQYDLNMSLTKD